MEDFQEKLIEDTKDQKEALDGQEEKRQPTFRMGYLIILVIFGALGNGMFGYNTGVIAGAQLYLDDDFPEITTLQIGTVVASAILGAAVGSLLIGPFTDRYGLIPTIILSDLFYGIGGGCSGLAQSVEQLILFRFISGVGEGIASMVTPIYISQMSPNSIRGGLVSTMQFCIAMGMLISYITCLLLGSNWRLMFALICIPATIQLIGAFILPEPPSVLLSQGKEEKAHQVLKKIYHPEDIADVLAEKQIEVDILVMQKKYSYMNQVTQLFTKYKYSLIAGMGLQFCQQMSGINTIMYYGPSILQMAGFGKDSENSDSLAILLSIPLIVITTLGNFWAIFYLDKYGRRFLLLLVLPFMCLGLLGLALGLGFQNWGSLSVQDFSKWLSFGSIIVFLWFFSIGMGPIPWTVNSEIYPLHLRGMGASLATTTNWTTNYFIAQLFLTASSTPVGEVVTFSGLGIGCLVTWTFVYVMLPETKGKTMEENVCTINNIDRKVDLFMSEESPLIR